MVCILTWKERRQKEDGIIKNGKRPSKDANLLARYFEISLSAD
jgi:hypothetical protein